MASSIGSASAETGPLAASIIKGVFIRSAFFSVITSSIAAGIKISASASSISFPDSWKPGNPFMEPFATICCFNSSILIPFSSTIEPSLSNTCVIRALSSKDKNNAAWKPTLPRPWTIILLPFNPELKPVFFKSFSLSKKALRAYWTPLPVASVLPAIPPLLTGFPVTQAHAFKSVGFRRLYSSAIHAISLSPVPTSGAGTFWEGCIKSLFASSCANRLVILSNSSGFQSLGLIINPPLDPPKGTSTNAHLYVISAARASTSPWLTARSYLIPPFTGSKWSECTERKPTKVCIVPLSLTPNLTV